MKSRIKQIALFCAVAAVLSLFFFRHALMAGALDLVLQRAAQGEMSYESRRWEANKLIYEGLRFGCSFYAPKVEFDCLFHRTPFYFEVHLTFAAPKVYVESQRSGSFLAALVPSRFLVVKCDIEQGEIELEGNPALLSFTFVSGAARDEIGTLVVYDGKDRLFYSEFLKAEDNLVTEWDITGTPVKRLIELSQFFYPTVQEGWSDLFGIADIHGKCDWDRNFTLINTVVNANFQALNITNTLLGIHMQSDACEAQLNYPTGNRNCPIWEQIIGFVLINGGEFLLSEPLVQKPWGIVDCNLMLSLDPHDNPHCELEGKVFHQGEAYPLSFHAKGAVHDDASFWIEGGLKAFATNLDFSFCSSSRGSYVVQADVHEMDQPCLAMILEGVAFRFPAIQDLAIPNGRLQGCITSWFENGEMKRIQCNGFHIQDLYVEWLESNPQVFLSDVRLSGEMVKDAEWNVVDLNLDLKNSAVAHEKWRFSELEASICMSQNEFKNALVKGVFMGIGGEVRLSGLWPEAQAVCHFAAPLAEWLQIPQTGGSDPLVHLYGMCKRGGAGFAVSGLFNSESEELRFKAFLDRSGHICEGEFECSRLSSVNYRPLLRCFDSNVQVEGIVSVAGVISPTEIKTQIATDRFYLASPKVSLEISKTLEAELTYAFQEGNWRGEVPLKGGKLKEHFYGLTLDQLDAELCLKDHTVHIEKGSALCEGIAICGQADFSFNEEAQLQIATESIEGSVENLSKLCARFPQNRYRPLLSEGLFSSGKNGFHLFLQKKGEEINVDWRLKAKFQEVSLKLSEQALLENLMFDLDFDSSVQVGALSHVKGDLFLKAAQYGFASDFIHYKDHRCEFDVQLEKEGQEILKVFGSGKEAGSGKIEFSMVHENNHFYSSSWDKLSFCLEKKGITAFEFYPRLQGKDLYSQAVFLSNSGLLPLDSSHLELLKKLEGEIQARLSLSTGNFSFDAEGTSLSFDGTPIPNFDLKGRKTGEEWIFEKISAADLIFKGTLSQGVCPSWEARWKDAVVKGEAVIGDAISCRIKAIEGVLPFPYSITGLSKIQISFSPQITLQGIDLGFFQNENQIGRVWTEVLVYNSESKKWEAERVGFKGSPFGNNEIVAGFLNVKWAPSFFSFQGVVEEGGLSFNEIAVKPSQIMGFYETPYFHFKSQAMLGKAPLYIQAKLNPSKQFQGSVTIQDKGKKDGVVFSMRDARFCKSIIGSLYGLEFHLQRNQLTAPFSGKIAIRDGNNATQLFPESFFFLKDVKNLELTGSWTGDLIFQGELRGKDFEFKNYFFKEIYAGVCFSPKHASFKNIAIADPAGTISIKLVECVKRKNWMVDVPLVKVQNFRPSLVRKAGVDMNEVKPFLIRNLILSDVHAEIDKEILLFGKGSLNFTNAFKKEASLFETPITMLKNLGLDLELFSPASGEVECVLKDKKIFLTNLKNTFSEGNRSQFYFAPDLEPSFIDLDGNLHINVRMKQDVVMKLAEPFVLTIRGTWEKPSYGLK